MPNANMGLEEKGFKHADIQRANRRMTCLRAMPKAWKAVAEQQEKLAEESAAMGNMVTAGAFYHRAALYYGKAQASIIGRCHEAGASTLLREMRLQ